MKESELRTKNMKASLLLMTRPAAGSTGLKLYYKCRCILGRLNPISILLILVLNLGQFFNAGATLAAKPSIWFCPLDPLVRGGQYGGAPDYMDLFTPTAPWKKAAARVNVFKIYPQWIDGASDADLRTQFADLKRRHIALALEFGVLSPTDGWVSEGYGGQDHHLLKAVRRIQEDGGNLAYIAMDEPIYFGATYRKPGFTPLTVDQMVEDAAVNIKEMWRVFPDVKVGDIEPLVSASAQGLSTESLIARYRDGIEAFETILGKPLAFFDADLDWDSKDFPNRLAAVSRMVRTTDVPFGVIYNGNGEDQGNTSWLLAARRHVAECEATIGTPDIVIFQSWNPYPRRLLPETDRDAFTSLINDYFGQPTRMSLAVSNSRVSGRLSTKTGAGIAGATINITLRPQSSLPMFAAYTASGQIPDGARMAVLAIRVNNEGASVGRCDVGVKEMRFEADGQAPVVREFTDDPGKDVWPALGSSPDGAAAAIQNGILHLTATSSQTLLLNSQPVPVATRGVFRFSVIATVPIESVGNGYFALVFIGDKGEIGRTRISFDLPITTLPPLKTGLNGMWSVSLPSPGKYLAESQYDGDTQNWPCIGKTAGTFSTHE
jgi:hypothetical protein